MNVEEQIRQRAHEIWESEGCPEGRDVEHWQQARSEVEPFQEEGDPLAGSVESSVAIPMPKPQG